MNQRNRSLQQGVLNGVKGRAQLSLGLTVLSQPKAFSMEGCGRTKIAVGREVKKKKGLPQTLGQLKEVTNESRTWSPSETQIPWQMSAVALPLPLC